MFEIRTGRICQLMALLVKSFSLFPPWSGWLITWYPSRQYEVSNNHLCLYLPDLTNLHVIGSKTRQQDQEMRERKNIRGNEHRVWPKMFEIRTGRTVSWWRSWWSVWLPSMWSGNRTGGGGKITSRVKNISWLAWSTRDWQRETMERIER